MYYDIGEAFQKIEEEMIASMSRNLKRHVTTENEEKLNYTMWQAEQLAALNNFRKNNKKKFESYFSTINDQIEKVIKKANESGQMQQEIDILEAIREGYKIYDYTGNNSIRGNFFKINERKLNALINATKNDMIKAETAMLRKANDEYRKIIFNAQAFYNTGAGTLSQCVDMATKDFLSKGITCVEYANGAMVGIDSYARMALRTAQTRAYLQGESTKRDEWGINTVIVNKRGVACPKCLKWVGKVYYDDVWGSTPVPSPAKYPCLSEAIAGGLYHPNCKDVHTTYFEGVSSKPVPMTKKQVDEANRVYALEQRQRYNEKMIRKYKMLYQNSTDPENIVKYKEKMHAWQEENAKFVKANSDVLKRRPELEKVFNLPDNFVENRDIIKEDPCANGHSYVETIIKQPNCTDKGKKLVKCTVCGDEHTEEIPALGHELKYDVIPPTCTEEGYTIISCSRCGKVIEAKADIKPALDHDWGAWVVTRRPTITEYGRKQKICKRCGAKGYTTIPKLKTTTAAPVSVATQQTTPKPWTPERIKKAEDNIKKQIKQHGGLTPQQQAEFESEILSGWTDEQKLVYEKYSKPRLKNNNYHYTIQGAHYDPSVDIVNMDINNNLKEQRLGLNQTAAWQTKFHEEFHQIDQTLFGSAGTSAKITASGKIYAKPFRAAMENDILQLINKTARTQYKTFAAAVNNDTAIQTLVRHLRSTYTTDKQKAQISMVTDALGLATKDKFSPHKYGFWGHNSKYNQRGIYSALSEFWATYGGNLMTNNVEALNEVRNLFPNSVAECDNIFNMLVARATPKPKK